MQPPPESSLPGWLKALIPVAVLGGVGTVAFLLDQRRNRALSGLASELGLTYHEHGGGGLRVPQSFLLAPSGRFSGAGAVRRLLKGEIEGIEVAVFEYRRIVDPAKGTTRGYPTVVSMFAPADLDLPDFVLRPERIYHKVLTAVLDQDIDFTGSPDFSSHYRLQGQDEGAVRRLFTPRVRGFFEQHRDHVAQVTGGRLFYYRPTKMLQPLSFRPSRVRGLLREGLELIGLMREAAGP